MRDIVIVGAVGKPFGVRGDVYVHPDVDLDHAFPVGQTYVTDRGTLTCAATREHAGRRVVRFEEASDREGAQALRGTVLSLDRDEVGLEEGAFWVDELLGAEVVDADGIPVGVLSGVLDAPAHDLLVVTRADGQEVLVPAVDELVDIAGGRVRVASVPGLLDPEEVDHT